MRVRKYRTSDCGDLAELFYHTVYSVNAKDYTKEQLDAWADCRKQSVCFGEFETSPRRKAKLNKL